MFQENPEFGVGIHPSAALGRRASECVSWPPVYYSPMPPPPYANAIHTFANYATIRYRGRENEAKTSSYDQVNRHNILGIHNQSGGHLK